MWEGRESRRAVEAKLESQRQELARSVASANEGLQRQVQGLDERMTQSLQAVQGSLNQSLSATTETIGKIGQQLGGLKQSTERILEVGRQVSSLQDVLKPPKLRGGFGELLLERLLRQVLPAADFSTQHQFKNGDRVDVVIHTPEGLVPVDSKFPIDSFRRVLDASTDEERTRQRRAFIRDVRRRIDEVAKYIRPEENTLDFALMYVPAENVYYETIVGADDESAMSYALDRRVHLVSPNTFHAFLQALVRGLNGLRVEERQGDHRPAGTGPAGVRAVQAGVRASGDTRRARQEQIRRAGQSWRAAWATAWRWSSRRLRRRRCRSRQR